MPSNILMPKTGADAVDAKLVRWFKKEGDTVARGDVVAEIETEKVNMEVEAFSAGVLHRILVAEGESLPVGQPIAVLLKEGEAPPAEQAPSAAPAPRAAEPVAAAAAPAVQAAAASNGHAVDGRLKASPIARRLAQEFNLDLAAIAGRGPAGRITKADVEAVIERGAAAPTVPVPAFAPSPAPAAAPVPVAPTPVAPAPVQAAPVPEAAPLAASAAAPVEAGVGATVQDLTRIQLTTGRRLAESKQQAPHFYITTEIDMAAALDLRATLNEKAGGAFKISVNDLVIKAAAWALGKHPRLNSSFRDGKLLIFDHVHMSVAMAIEDGLVSPVLRDVDRKSLGQIARDSRALIERARNGKLKLEDLSDGTFTISNLGMYDVDTFVAIINPPQAAILAVGAVREVPVVRNGELAIGKVLKATVSVDHRAADGAQAAQFLIEVRNALENPLLMAL